MQLPGPFFPACAQELTMCFSTLVEQLQQFPQSVAKSIETRAFGLMARDTALASTHFDMPCECRIDFASAECGRVRIVFPANANDPIRFYADRPEPQQTIDALGMRLLEAGKSLLVSPQSGLH